MAIITPACEDFKKYKVRIGNARPRVLGIDFGMSVIGLALSDIGGTLASPYSQLGNKSYRELLPELGRIVAGNDVGLVVLGLPLEMGGGEGGTAAKVRSFAAALGGHLPDIDIVLMDERLTSAISEKSLVRDFDMSRAKRRRILDKLSAARILQQFLDMANGP